MLLCTVRTLKHYLRKMEHYHPECNHLSIYGRWTKFVFKTTLSTWLRSVICLHLVKLNPLLCSIDLKEILLILKVFSNILGNFQLGGVNLHINWVAAFPYGIWIFNVILFTRITCTHLNHPTDASTWNWASPIAKGEVWTKYALWDHFSCETTSNYTTLVFLFWAPNLSRNKGQLLIKWAGKYSL